MTLARIIHLLLFLFPPSIQDITINPLQAFNCPSPPHSKTITLPDPPRCVKTVNNNKSSHMSVSIPFLLPKPELTLIEAYKVQVYLETSSCWTNFLGSHEKLFHRTLFPYAMLSKPPHEFFFDGNVKSILVEGKGHISCSWLKTVNHEVKNITYLKTQAILTPWDFTVKYGTVLNESECHFSEGKCFIDSYTYIYWKTESPSCPFTVRKYNAIITENPGDTHNDWLITVLDLQADFKLARPLTTLHDVLKQMCSKLISPYTPRYEYYLTTDHHIILLPLTDLNAPLREFLPIDIPQILKKLDTSFFPAQVQWLVHQLQNQVQDSFNQIVDQFCQLRLLIYDFAISVRFSDPTRACFWLLHKEGIMCGFSGRMIHYQECYKISNLTLIENNSACTVKWPVLLKNSIPRYYNFRTNFLEQSSPSLNKRDCLLHYPQFFQLSNGSSLILDPYHPIKLEDRPPTKEAPVFSKLLWLSDAYPITPIEYLQINHIETIEYHNNLLLQSGLLTGLGYEEVSWNGTDVDLKEFISNSLVSLATVPKSIFGTITGPFKDILSSIITPIFSVIIICCLIYGGFKLCPYLLNSCKNRRTINPFSRLRTRSIKNSSPDIQMSTFHSSPSPLNHRPSSSRTKTKPDKTGIKEEDRNTRKYLKSLLK